MGALSILNETRPRKVYKDVVIFMALAVTWAAGIIGVRVYADDQADSARRLVEQAAFSNARDERIRCEQRVESREQIRGAFLGVYDLLDELVVGNEFTVAARQELDQDYPPLNLDDCPPEPMLVVAD